MTLSVGVVDIVVAPTLRSVDAFVLCAESSGKLTMIQKIRRSLFLSQRDICILRENTRLQSAV